MLYIVKFPFKVAVCEEIKAPIGTTRESRVAYTYDSRIRWQHFNPQ